ncbi:hypothetical protein PG994_006090 [Apiospora phragmitis]|uniref:Dynein light chain n=1 Tax=Apiospora phragmitis TaxID=2905665 RepID=A0ABR1VE26_9PEZI
MATPNNIPVGATRLRQIATDACQSAIGGAEYYEHAKVEHWNSSIINSILKALISEATPSGSQGPAHKFIVNSTIEPRISTSDGGATATDGKPHVGRRGMHSATQAFWNEKTDGMWSFKYDGGESKGMDVVISVIWVAV